MKPVLCPPPRSQPSSARTMALASVIALVGLAPCGYGAASEVPSAPLREQVIPLRAGWNAVFVEVEPVDSEPARLRGAARGDRLRVLPQPIRPLTFATPATRPGARGGLGGLVCSGTTRRRAGKLERPHRRSGVLDPELLRCDLAGARARHLQGASLAAGLVQFHGVPGGPRVTANISRILCGLTRPSGAANLSVGGRRLGAGARASPRPDAGGGGLLGVLRRRLGLSGSA